MTPSVSNSCACSDSEDADAVAVSAGTVTHAVAAYFVLSHTHMPTTHSSSVHPSTGRSCNSKSYLFTSHLLVHLRVSDCCGETGDVSIIRHGGGAVMWYRSCTCIPVILSTWPRRLLTFAPLSLFLGLVSSLLVWVSSVLFVSLRLLCIWPAAFVRCLKRRQLWLAAGDFLLRLLAPRWLGGLCDGEGGRCCRGVSRSSGSVGIPARSASPLRVSVSTRSNTLEYVRPIKISKQRTLWSLLIYLGCNKNENTCTTGLPAHARDCFFGVRLTHPYI